ncbi:hypothetical protein K439DRAFT_1631393, partial [Ramaria rubella]
MPQVRSTVHGFQAHNTRESPFFIPNVSDNDLSVLSAKTLVVPIVSAANIPQLAVDVLIASLSLFRLGTFDASSHVPVVGGREGGELGVTTPLELFGKEGVDVVVIQQRSPVLKGQKDIFISSLLNFVKEKNFKSVLVVSGVDSINRTDSQMHTPMYHLFPPSSDIAALPSLKYLNSLPKYTAGQTFGKGPSLPGGGLTRRLLSSISDNLSSNTGFLIWMGMEGDNRDDAKFVANAIAKILSVEEKIKEWKEPESWQHGLFGTPNDHSLFG